MDTRTHVMTIAKRIYSNRLVIASLGNVSCRDKSGTIAITPSGVDYEELSVQDIVTIDIHGTPLQEGRTPSSETPMHTVIYRERPDIMGIVHTHSLSASAFSVVNQEIPVEMVEVAAHVGGSIPVAPYRPPGTKELGEKALEMLKGRRACLLQNHGVLAVGTTLEKAYKAAAITEVAARIHILAAVLGNPGELPEHEVNKVRDLYFTL
jgi:L-ribulose-5-phosphate 4-epimerase